jgi:hypothetical protein
MADSYDLILKGGTVVNQDGNLKMELGPARYWTQNAKKSFPSMCQNKGAAARVPNGDPSNRRWNRGGNSGSVATKSTETAT